MSQKPPTTPPAAMAECPRCDPCNPDMDEDGRPYSCYCCGDTGWVPREVIEEMERQDAAYRAANPPAPPRLAPAPMPARYFEDDIPF